MLLNYKFFNLYLILILLISPLGFGQSIHSSVPKKINKSGRYLFYLHGRIIEEQGINAISPEFGAYEYMNILNTLKEKKFYVISEARPKNTDIDRYSDKVSQQIDTLLSKGVPAENIFVLGASKGGFIAMLTSTKVKNKKINYAVMGVCSKMDSATFTAADRMVVYGNFLSVYENSDPYGNTCEKLFANQDGLSGFKEISLSMNNQHGFLYKPYDEWVKPFVEWANLSENGKIRFKLHSIDTLYAKWDSDSTPGCIVAVIKDGKFIYNKSFGMANLEYKIPISSKTVFDIGSVTKQFTCAAILLLNDEGKLSLEDDIRKYFPNLLKGIKDTIRIKNLLYNQSGLKDDYKLSKYTHKEITSFKDFEVFVSHQEELDFKPGESFKYCNTNFILMAKIIELVSHQSYSDYLGKKIFAPLKMHDTRVGGHNKYSKQQLAMSYTYQNGKYELNYGTIKLPGAGGVLSTIEDLFLWDQNFYHNQLGKDKIGLIKRMYTTGLLNSGRDSRYAAGLWVRNFNDVKVIEHAGDMYSFHSRILRVPEENLSVIFLSNDWPFRFNDYVAEVANISVSKNLFLQNDKTQIIDSVKYSYTKGNFYSQLEQEFVKVYFNDNKLILESPQYNFEKTQLFPMSDSIFVSADRRNMVKYIDGNLLWIGYYGDVIYKRLEDGFEDLQKIEGDYVNKAYNLKANITKLEGIYYLALGNERMALTKAFSNLYFNPQKQISIFFTNEINGPHMSFENVKFFRIDNKK